MNKVLKWFTRDSFILPVVAILMGLILGGIVMLIGGYNPFEAYGALFKKVFGDMYNFGEAVREMTPLIMTGLAFAFAARAGLFNIGGEGQFLVGMTAATFVGVKFTGLPIYIHAPLALIAGAVFGGLWAAIAGYLKAARGVNEVISSIMLNWIGLYLANLIVRQFLLLQGRTAPLISASRPLSV